MSGKFETGDIIIIKQIKEESELKTGDIITYATSEKTLVTHRIIEITEENGKTKYTTKGDANNTEDKEKIEFKDIHGKYLFKIPLIGQIIDIIQKPTGTIIVLTIPTILIIIFLLKQQRREKKKTTRREKRLKYEIERNKKMENKE